ncbi:hypothetical protein OG568_49085 (plasmid) [Streptomyces sp. NBC_01450]|uniref:hypothetical protein n=1 Tax=Streptomyces sp. NBC_01450 TaxID=2903871 RepID=UPI002E35B11E|nr:hypothetical protein [Streptomyces sp. NBC_01450]
MTEPSTRPARRTVLNAGLGLAGGLTLWGVGVPSASAAPSADVRHWTGRKSANGWPVVPSAAEHRIEGSPASLTALDGDVAAVLLYVARRFHYEVDSLGRDDVHGHTTQTSVAADYESNYLSGTAISIRPEMYPVGAEDRLFPQEVAVVRDILTECEGVVRWGGDDRRSPKQGHFQIDVPPGSATLKKVAGKFNGWDDKPGQGAGTPEDIFGKSRRTAAKRLADRQRATA